MFHWLQNYQNIHNKVTVNTLLLVPMPASFFAKFELNSVVCGRNNFKWVSDFSIKWSTARRKKRQMFTAKTKFINMLEVYHLIILNTKTILKRMMVESCEIDLREIEWPCKWNVSRELDSKNFFLHICINQTECFFFFQSDNFSWYFFISILFTTNSILDLDYVAKNRCILPWLWNIYFGCVCGVHCLY